MARRKKAKTSSPQYTLLTIRIDRYEAAVEAEVNPDIAHPEYAFRPPRDEDPLLRCVTTLTVFGISTDPGERAGDRYRLTIRGEDTRRHALTGTLADIRTEDEHGVRQYRKYRGVMMPVYNPVPGLALLDRGAGKGFWTSWINLPRGPVSDMLTLLSKSTPIYAALHEQREGRTTWLQSVALQTTNPADE